jgi:predicted RNA-binding protein YlxR (DUF448 family)
MLRFVLGPGDAVVPDIRRKLPGRGVWTSLSADAVRCAASKGAFARAFRAKVVAPADLARDVDALLERDALQSLSMANKAGLVVAGAFKVDAAIADGGIAVLIQASEGAADGLAKRERALRSQEGAGTDIARLNFFSSYQLSLALGRATVIHAALKSGAATSAFLARAERLRCFRAAETDGIVETGGGKAPGLAPAMSARINDSAEKPAD